MIFGLRHASRVERAHCGQLLADGPDLKGHPVFRTAG
jgi:hypothetical protein